MPSLLPVLVNDPDLPANLRADLLLYETASSPVQRRAAGLRASIALRVDYGLDTAEVRALLARANPALPLAA